MLTVSLTKSLGKISVDSAGLRSLTTATNATNRAFERASVSAAAFQRHLSGIQATGAGAALSGHRLPPVGSWAAPGGGVPPRLPGGGGRGGGGGGGFHGGNIHLGAGGVGLGTVGMAAGDWFWPLAASGAAIYGGKALFESAKDLDTEKQRFKLFGLSDAQNNEAFRFASGMHVYGMTQTENMRNFREAQGVFREAGLNGSSALDGAKLAAPILSRLNALDSSLDDESAARSHSSNLAMLKWVESAGGLKSQAEFNRLANMGYKLKVGSGDTVDWAQLQQFQKRAGSAAINISGEGMARIEPSISTLGGSATGVALATDFGRLQGIVKNLPVPVIDELLKYGVWDKSKVALNSKGGIAKFLDPNGPMSTERSKLLSENPEGFYEQVIRPIYTRMNLDAAGVIRQNAMIYGRTGGALANEWEKQLQTISRAVAAFNKTKDIKAATDQLPQSLTGQQQEFEAAWTDFKTNFGTTALPFFTGILKGGADILRQLPSGGTTIGHATATLLPGGALISSLWDMLSNGHSTDKHFVPGGRGGQTVQINVSADARKMGIAVTAQQAKGFAMPQTGGGFFDSLQSLTPAGGV